MIKFLINRPIAVSMTFLALSILGVLTSLQLPISLLPEINIPKISVQAGLKNASASEVENTVIKPLRRALLQINHLKNIKSETRAGSGIIQLSFEYGTDIDYAFIEVNEKIDRSLNLLPKEVERPRVIKASAGDIPVFYLNLNLKTEEQNTKQNNLFPVSQQIVDLSRFANQVIKKRIEQLPEVAMVDISGLVASEILIIPDMQKMESLGLSINKLENLIKSNNLKLGNLVIRDGQYQYNIRFANHLRNKKDIENIYLKKDSSLLQIKQIVQVIEHPQKRKGLVISDGKTAVSMAVIKQSDAKIQDVEKALSNLTANLKNDYPGIEFTVTRDQTKLLNYSINNLTQSLLLGAFLAFIIMFVFLKDIKSPLLIGISMPVSIIITLLLFYLGGISINIISLSGLILGIGMMIDNSIIVIDNINQYRERGTKLDLSCIKGTNEVFRPLLSSILTTIAVYVPLIFVGGISGAMFYEQALAISIGLFVSLAVSISLIPVYYKLFYKKETKKKNIRFLEKINKLNYASLYEKGFRLIMRHQKASMTLALMMIIMAILLFIDLKKQQLPEFKTDEMLLYIDWNERINVLENQKRILNLYNLQKEQLLQYTAFVGEQQFLLNFDNQNSASEALIYLKAQSPAILKQQINNYKLYLKDNYPKAHFRFRDADNIFNVIFGENQAPLIARLRPAQAGISMDKNNLSDLLIQLRKQIPEYPIPFPEMEEQMVLQTNPALLKLYDIDYATLYNKIKMAFNEHGIFTIAGNSGFLPVIIGTKQQNINQIIAQTMIRNTQGNLVPLSQLIVTGKDTELKYITAGQEGVYYPLSFNISDKDEQKIIQKVKQILKENRNFEVSFTGSLFENRVLIKQIALILLISLLLLYFILAAQFESLTLPVIVLLEVPVDLFGAFFMLWLFNSSINLMSLIGIIVMSGIIINDSILKIDTVNQLRRQGFSLMRALLEAGHRRLKPILMTSLTTILALLPFLFVSGLGAELQKPLALSIIGGMILGTLVSLYLVPLLYYYLKK